MKYVDLSWELKSCITRDFHIVTQEKISGEEIVTQERIKGEILSLTTGDPQIIHQERISGGVLPCNS